MGSKKANKIVLEEILQNTWQSAIENASLDDENWTVKVILIEAAGSDQDRMYLNRFENCAAEEKRFVIKNICKTETIFMINQLGAEKKVKDDSLKVFEEAQSFLKLKKDIPPDILALVIKHLIIKMKEEYLYIKKQRLEVRLGMRRESATMIDKAEIKGTVSARNELERSSSKLRKAMSVAGFGDTEGKKFNTLLRVRGEEWRDKIYVDDYPTDGPNLYVAVTGFVEPYLPGCLVKIGIPLTAVVQIRIDPSTTTVPSSLLRQTKRGQSVTELLTEASLKFWDELQLLRIHRDSADDFKNTAFIVFSPPYWNTQTLSGSPDKIYDELCYLMYDIQDLSRQHINYKENMFVMNIPKDFYQENYFKHYQHLVENIPLECITIYSVLDSILQIACTTQDLDDKSFSSLSTAITLNAPPKHVNEDKKLEKAEHLIRDVFTQLCNTEASKKKYRFTYGEEYETHKDPVIIDYGDLAKYNTFHLENINLDDIIITSLLGMPINNLWRNQSRPTGELEAKINFHINVLLSCFDRRDVETAELNRLIHILACRKLYNNRSSLKKHHLPPSTRSDFKKNYLKRSVLAEPLPKCPSLITYGQVQSPSFPSMTKSENESEIAACASDPDPEVQRIKFLFDCPDLSELVLPMEIENFKPISHYIDDFLFFEDFSKKCSFQIMREAFNKFNCVDYKYCEVTDCFILMFFNSHDKEGIAREEWRCHLPTPLCLQDFFDFVLEEHYDWIQSQEKQYDEHVMIKARSMSRDLINPFALQSCLETKNVEQDLLMENSLKYNDVVNKFEKISQEDSDTVEPANKSRDKSTARSIDMDSKGSKRTKSGSSPKNLRQSFVGAPQGSQDSIEIPAKPFLGYNLGDRRVEVFGQDTIFFSKDGTKITSIYTLTIPTNLEYIVLSVLPGNSYNEFWVHRALGEYLNSEIIDKCESFRITSKEKVMIYIKKQTYQTLPMAIDSIEPNVSQPILQVFEKKHFHSLFVTCPNGMITETVYENNSPVISHIKQYYTRQMPHLDEDMRCVSLNGEVIIFKPSGDIEVLIPDGTFIKLTKYCKTLVVHETESDIEPEKTKKKLSKGKIGKLSSKSSKLTGLDEDKISAEKAPEYVIKINEFEIIETTGLRQKWINDVPLTIEKLLIRTATDYCLGEVFSRRMDGTNTLLNEDGFHVVTFPNKTRIITSYVIEDEDIYPEWTDVELQYFEMYPDTVDGIKWKESESQKSFTGTYANNSSSGTSMSKKIEEEDVREHERLDGYVSVQIVYTIEHSNFSTVTINKVNGTISIDSPNETRVTVDNNNYYDIKLDNVTLANFDGENLKISYEACSECNAYTTCNIKIKSYEQSSGTDLGDDEIWLKMKDSYNKKVVVNYEGGINILDEPSEDDVIYPEGRITSPEDANECPELGDEKAPDGKSENSFLSHAKCREMYWAKNIKFFILNRELQCSELVHRALLDQYKRDCRWQPWCTINQYDTFGDHRRLVSVLTPVHLTETEKWLMNSKLADKPKFLTYKDLKKDSGKGFYHWMRPYPRFEPKPIKPETVLPQRLPRAFVLRTLEQEWVEAERPELKGARELVKAILRYRCIMEADTATLLNIPIIDRRSEVERNIDDVVQALAHRIYEDLRVRLAEDVQHHAKAMITTQPPVEDEDYSSVEGEYYEEESTDISQLQEDEREILISEAEAAEEMSPNLRSYWRRRAEEYKEEQFYKYLLREGSVPPYFLNMLGGAIWWEMNNAASEAVTIAEDRKMMCICATEESDSKAALDI